MSNEKPATQTEVRDVTRHLMALLRTLADTPAHRWKACGIRERTLLDKIGSVHRYRLDLLEELHDLADEATTDDSEPTPSGE